VKEAEVVASELVEAREAASIVLELADKALDEMTLLVKLLVVVTRLFAVRLGRDNWLSPPVHDGEENRVGIVRLVAQDELHFVAFK